MTLASLLLFLFVAVLALHVLYVTVRRSRQDSRVLPAIDELQTETKRLKERLDAVERRVRPPADCGMALPKERAAPPAIAFEPNGPTVTLAEEELLLLRRSLALQIRAGERTTTTLTPDERRYASPRRRMSPVRRQRM